MMAGRHRICVGRVEGVSHLAQDRRALEPWTGRHVLFGSQIGAE
jgi:hypothetical protein